MTKFLNPKVLLTFAGLCAILIGTFFFINPSTIAKDTFSEHLLTAEGMKVAEYMQEALGSIFIGLGVFIFSMRNIEPKAAKKVVVGLGLCASIFFIGGIFHLLKNDVHPPLPALVSSGTIIVLCAVVANQD